MFVWFAASHAAEGGNIRGLTLMYPTLKLSASGDRMGPSTAAQVTMS